MLPLGLSILSKPSISQRPLCLTSRYCLGLKLATFLIKGKACVPIVKTDRLGGKEAWRPTHFS